MTPSMTVESRREHHDPDHDCHWQTIRPTGRAIPKTQIPPSGPMVPQRATVSGERQPDVEPSWCPNSNLLRYYFYCGNWHCRGSPGVAGSSWQLYVDCSPPRGHMLRRKTLKKQKEAQRRKTGRRRQTRCHRHFCQWPWPPKKVSADSFIMIYLYIYILSTKRGDNSIIGKWTNLWTFLQHGRCNQNEKEGLLRGK
jgi:hypothetical protein